MRFEFSKSEVDYIIENAGFTEDEIEVFLLRWKGKSIVAISSELHLSGSTVDRRISSIKRKIRKIL